MVRTHCMGGVFSPRSCACWTAASRFEEKSSEDRFFFFSILRDASLLGPIKTLSRRVDSNSFRTVFPLFFIDAVFLGHDQMALGFAQVQMVDAFAGHHEMQVAAHASPVLVGIVLRVAALQFVDARL